MVSRRYRANRSVGNKLLNLQDKVIQQQKTGKTDSIASQAITDANIADGTIQGISLDDRAVTSDKIARGAITTSNLGIINTVNSDASMVLRMGGTGHLALEGDVYESPYESLTDADGLYTVAFDPADNALKILEATPPAPDGLRFDTTYTGGSLAPGMLSWNAEDETLEVQVGNGEVTLQIGQESHVRGYNNTGVTITNGQVVYLVGGANGTGHPYVAPYLADGTISPFRVVGIATQSIANGADGLITVQGKVRGLDTSAYVNGEVLYASTSTYGALQVEVPSAPDAIVSLGAVAVSDATDGEILVSVSPVLNQFQTNLVLFPTTTASDVGGYYRLVDSTLDADYDSPAVDVSTGTLNSADDVLVGSLIADANEFVGDLGDLQVTVAGSITKTSGNANTSAGFYFKVFKRTSSGTETLMGTSDVTSAVLLSEASPVGPFAFIATANVVFETFVNTDRLVVKFYANTIEDGSQSYTFTYGGTTPVRILIPAPSTSIISDPVPTSVNYLLNGDFSIWQRGTSFGATDGFGPDRWWFDKNGTTTEVQETVDVPDGFRYAFKLDATTSSDYIYVQQSLERDVVIPLRGKTVTFSCYLKLGSNMQSVPGDFTLNADYSTTTDARISQTTTIGAHVIDMSLYSGWARASYTFTVPSDAVGLRVGIEPPITDVTYSTSTYYVTGAMLEEGSIATKFRTNTSSPQAELAACQRYYQRITAGQAYSFFASGLFNSTTAFYMPVHLPVTMRTVPAFSWSGAFRVLTSGAGTVATLAIYDSSTNPVSIQGTITGTTTDGQAGVLGANNDVAAYIEFNSEL